MDITLFLKLNLLRSSICESLRSLAHSTCVNFNQAALRAVLKPDNMSSCQYTSNTNTHTVRLRVGFKYGAFRSLFEYISINYKTLEH